jgi:archaeosine synthase
LRTLSRFLYGTDVFGEDIRIKGRGIKQVFEGSRCVASFDKTIRPFAMNAPVRRRWVSMMDFELKGDLFCVGIEDADDDIRPGDEVVILRNGEMVAAGRALLSGHMMARMRRGKAVNVKKRCG